MALEFEGTRYSTKYTIEDSSVSHRKKLILKPTDHNEASSMLELLGQQSREKYDTFLDYPFQLQKDKVYRESEFFGITFKHTLRFFWEKDDEGDKMTIPNALSLKGCTFDEGIDFDNCIFQGNVRLHQCLFKGDLKFYNTSFQKLIDFYESKFDTSILFHLTDFDEKTIFSKCLFNHPLQFLHNKVSSESYFSFEGATMKYDLDLSRSNIICPIQFWNLKLELNLFQILTRHEVGEFYVYDNSETSIVNYEYSRKQLAFKKLRETYRLIKKNLGDSKNGIEVLGYIENERNAYFYELIFGFRKFPKIPSYKSNLDILASRKSKVWKFSKIFTNHLNYLIRVSINPIQWFSIILRLFNLALNKVSSNHGRSWFQGILFTYIVAQLAFVIHGAYFLSGFEWTLDPYKSDLEQTFVKSVRMIIPTDFNYKIESLERYDSSEESNRIAFLFLAKIFIGFGIYQTVQAFRNLGKNSG